MDTLVREVQPSKAARPISCTPSGISRVSREVHPEKAEFSKQSNLEGSLTLFREVQFSKICSGRVVMPSPNVRFVREVQPSKLLPLWMMVDSVFFLTPNVVPDGRETVFRLVQT